MPKRVIISVTSDLCTDQRVQKVSLALQQAGYKVLLVGRLQKRSRTFVSSFPFKRLHLLFEKGILFYAEINIRLFFLLLFSKVDILLANDTDTLLANFLISKIRNKKLVFDAHELFPEVPEVTNRKFVKQCWTGIENFIFPKLHYSYTVCDSIANYYHKKYGISMQVIRNIPPYGDSLILKAMPLFKGKKIILYQGALNVGRGLEWIIDSMPLLDDNCMLVIIGNGDIRRELKQRVSKLKVKNKVHFIGKIMPEELMSYTKAADIGLCLLEKKGLSYYYALPNRVFDFIHAGVPILATNFPEIANIVDTYKTGVLIDHYEPEYLAEVINKMLETGKNDYQPRLKKLSKELCWEKEQQILINLFDQLYSKN